MTHGSVLVIEQVGEDRREIDEVILLGNLGHVASDGRPPLFAHVGPGALELAEHLVVHVGQTVNQMDGYVVVAK